MSATDNKRENNEATCMDMVAMMMVMKVIIVIRRRTSTVMIMIKMKIRHILSS